MANVVLAQLDVAGYVLAGGRSTRMGQDKALLRLAGVPLVQRAVQKLQRVAGDVHILSNRRDLRSFAPIVPDLRENCGPLGGIEAALVHARRQWALIMAVDTPFVPVALLKRWVETVVHREHARVSMFCVEGTVQPALCMLHRDIAPYVRNSLDKSRFRLYPELRDAAIELASRNHTRIGDALILHEWNEREAEIFASTFEATENGIEVTATQWASRKIWFANLNTPEEFAAAEQHADVLEY